MIEKYNKPLLFVVILMLMAVLALAGCTPVAPTESQADVADPIPPIPDLNPVRTEVAQTVVAEITVKAIADASDTSADTVPAQPTERVVKTVMVAVSSQNQSATPSPTLPKLTQPTETAVASSSSGSPTKVVPPYDCLQRNQDPLDGYKIVHGGLFDITWTVENTGTAIWETPTYDYMYLKGDKLHTFTDRKDIPHEVKPGQKVGLFVNMAAPATPGIYRTWWAVVDGWANPVCIVYLSIEVTN